ncbi:acyl-CoA dehydrogenase family protein [Litorihabitans aurantiacus]|uniref:Acyl-CoA dehydrogenase n=1 Tax=Litorihabitans aurantiacus TaxID=1930061 RepID=A0AA37UNF0_9MICO|nr:acyl-CoA dehydrogenase family protein [Litorihabitans aurantiacus]GMA30308.1 acyl-CoA dehydrogenase [Litorihabitans aurantiacus]
MARTLRTLLTDDVLARIHDRAAGHDATNTFPDADLADLVDLGYLRAFVPEPLGGAGLSLEEVAREQMRLAAAAPATALAVGMHLIVTGLAARLVAGGDDSVAFVLRDAAAGEIFAFGNSEAGNDLVMFDSLTRAEPDGAGGFRFHGTKIFTSLAPVWTRLATFGRDDSDPDDPRLVHGVVTLEGTRTIDDWDTLGMRATQSRSTVLEGAHAPADRVYRSLPVGPSADPFMFALFATFEVLIAAAYTGIAGRAVELGAESALGRRSRRGEGEPLAHDADVRRAIAEAATRHDGARLQVLALARDVDEGTDHGARWFAQLVGLKVRAVADARAVVESVVAVSGGAAYRTGSEVGRLYRDVLAGIFHPSDERSAHRTIATSILGPLPQP